uniref:Uncharacterized protein n=1 Tax=Strigamia maritima TaxID=126957 RepID=T1JKE4_STRMM
MFSFIDRLGTFKNWPIDFVSPRSLARAGFIYLDESDTVECVFCEGRIARWVKGDKPMIEHYRFSPYCPLMRIVFEDCDPEDMLTVMQFRDCGGNEEDHDKPHVKKKQKHKCTLL